MYTDTHTHLSGILERGGDIQQLLQELAWKKTPFVLDIGTNPGDILTRTSSVVNKDGKIPDFLYFSAGLWPSQSVIASWQQAIDQLIADLKFQLPNDTANRHRKIVAVGECGLDRRENTQATGSDLVGEAELFAAQIVIAKKHMLPLIIHSRDAFDETFSIIKNENYDIGVIHCFSYTKKEATAFLDRGWYISIPGTITYKHTEQLAEACAYIPDDRLLVETDAPYLPPVPFRGKMNTPLLISYTYEKIAALRKTTPEQIATIVQSNAQSLFLQSLL